MATVEIENRRNGCNVTEVVSINFLILKFSGLVNWSWTWVLAPIWVPYFALAIYLTVFFTIRYFKGDK